MELRDAPGDVSTATSSTTFEYQAVFLLKDGSIVGLDGISFPVLANQVINNLFVLIHHRNHIPILSASPIPLNGLDYEYNFTLSDTMVYGGTDGYVELSSGIWGLVAGDGLCDGQVELTDKIDVWEVEAGIEGYHSADFNLDGNVNNKDKNDYWKINMGSFFQEP
jgi:hypothetical protein